MANDSSPSPPDWTAAVAETVTQLRRMIQFDTTNPPGNELALARYIEGVLKHAGIESRLIEPVSGRAVLWARLPGDGSARPVLLTAHMDVVGVEADKWQSDPFGGEIRDGYLYGRGAIGDKGMVAVNLMPMLLAKRELVDKGATLSRDLIFLATSDEESGGEYGMEWVIANHPELVDAEYALNEGGRIRIVNEHLRYAAVQTAEKVSNVVVIRARGPGGHASIPIVGNAIVHLARAIARVSEPMPARLSDTTREFFARLAPVWPDRQLGSVMAGLASRVRAVESASATSLAEHPTLDATIRDTISVTMLDSGIRHNVIPTEAEAMLSVRTLP